MIITVSWGGRFEFKGSFAVYVSVVDIPIICARQVTDPWRHKSDLWRHRYDTASSMSTNRPKYSTKMHQTLLCRIERGTRWWRFHAATIDSFADMGSWSWKIMEFPKIWRLSCQNWAKYWPRAKNWPGESNLLVFSARLYDASFGNAKGGRTSQPTPPPLSGRRWRNTESGWGLKWRYFIDK